MNDKRIYLENSPLANTTLILLGNLKKKPSTSTINISPIQSIPKHEEKTIVTDFPFDIGRKIISDTLNSSYLFRFGQDQNYVNSNIKSAILESSSMSLSKLIKIYGVSICDLKIFRIVTDLDSLKKLKFKGLDLSIDRQLFNTSHLKTLFNINYADLIKNKIQFNLFVIVKGKFTFNELQTMNFDFDLCIKQTKGLAKLIQDSPHELIKFKGQLKEHFREIYTSRPPQLTYKQMVLLNLHERHLKYLDVKITDIQRYVI